MAVAVDKLPLDTAKQAEGIAVPDTEPVIGRFVGAECWATENYDGGFASTEFAVGQTNAVTAVVAKLPELARRPGKSSREFAGQPVAGTADFGTQMSWMC